MQFLAFTDLHGDVPLLKKIVTRAKKKDIDFVICAGDFTIFEHYGNQVLKELNKIEKQVLMVHGNHESIEYMKILKKYKNMFFIHEKVYKIKDIHFLGFGGGGFSSTDPEFRKIARIWRSKLSGKKTVLITHGPPYGNKTDKLGNIHVGNKDYSKGIERLKPLMHICGHIHETAGTVDKIGETIIINPGWEGKIIKLE